MLAWAMIGFRPWSSKLVLAEGAGKEASLVLAPLQLDDEGAFEPGLGEDHVRLTDGLVTVAEGTSPATALECLRSDVRTPSAISLWMWLMR